MYPTEKLTQQTSYQRDSPQKKEKSYPTEKLPTETLPKRQPTEKKQTDSNRDTA